MTTRPRRDDPRRTRDNARAVAPAPRPGEDADALREKMALRLLMLIGNQLGSWRACPEPACRRHRACCAPRSRCSNAPQHPPPTQEEVARTTAQLYRAIKAAVAARDAQGE